MVRYIEIEVPCYLFTDLSMYSLGIYVSNKATTHLHGEATAIHSNGQHGIYARDSSKVIIHLPSHHNTSYNNEGVDRCTSTGGFSFHTTSTVCIGCDDGKYQAQNTAATVGCRDWSTCLAGQRGTTPSLIIDRTCSNCEAGRSFLR